MIEVNLHPSRGKRSRIRAPKLSLNLPGKGGGEGGRDVWTTIAIVVPALVVLIVGWLWFSTRSERTTLEDQIAVAVQDSTRLADLRALSDSLISQDALIQERLRLVRSLDGGRFVWPRMLDEISRALPAYTWLTLVRREAPLPDMRIQVDGIAANPLAISRFVRNLQDSPYISQARIMGSHQQMIENVPAQAFELMLTHAPAAEPATGGS